MEERDNNETEINEGKHKNHINIHKNRSTKQ